MAWCWTCVAGNMDTQIILKANRRVRVIPNALTLVKRKLMGAGKILVSKNEEVKPQDIVGRSTPNAGFTSINIAKKLGVDPVEGGGYLKREIGKNIYEGELLALKTGFLGKQVITSPTDAVLEYYDRSTGELRMKLLSKEVPLPAGVNGIIEEVDSKNGEVFIKTLTTQIYGILGSGRERSGILDVLNGSAGLLNETKITSSLSGHVIVAGSIIYGDALRKAISLKLAGIIAGGMHFSEYKAIVGNLNQKQKQNIDIGISVVASEGFGPIPIGKDIFSILEKHEGSFVFIDGDNAMVSLPTATPGNILALRKTAIPVNTKPGGEIAGVSIKDITTGLAVRIIWPPFMGSVGKIISIDRVPTLLETGISTILVTIETAQQKLKVPYTNIEIVE